MKNKNQKSSSKKVYLEHLNITVADIDKSISFFQTVFPFFKVRHDEGKGVDRWVHLGDDKLYIALQQGSKDVYRTKDYSRNGVNHIGFVVEDVKAIAERLLAKGYQRSYPISEEEFRYRDYFVDADGFEYEFIQYHSNKPEEKNKY